MTWKIANLKPKDPGLPPPCTQILKSCHLIESKYQCFSTCIPLLWFSNTETSCWDWIQKKWEHCSASRQLLVPALTVSQGFPCQCAWRLPEWCYSFNYTLNNRAVLTAEPAAERVVPRVLKNTWAPVHCWRTVSSDIESRLSICCSSLPSLSSAAISTPGSSSSLLRESNVTLLTDSYTAGNIRTNYAAVYTMTLGRTTCTDVLVWWCV